MNRKLKARDIMTIYVKTVTPDMKIRKVWDEMVDYGHTGFPVVSKDKVLGIITRSDIDKALRHGFMDRQVEDFMSKTPIFVSSEEDIDKIKDLFIRYNIGRVLVMDNDKLVGIITRTDLLHADRIDLYDKEKMGSVFVHEKMKKALNPYILDLLYKFGDLGTKFGYNVYIVGGIVRDILLGYKNLDIDIVIEGDAIKFANEIAKEFNAQLTVFPEFGTATLKFTNGLRFDIATSRLEFYDYPGSPPKVEESSIKKDLYRRDFTINALAIQINREYFGNLIDFFGGRYDLEHKLIRILHNLSFIEDPSRILRAVRFETRYNFIIEEKTFYLLQKAISENYIEKIKAPKLKEEFFYILAEENPLKPIIRLKELKILDRIFPGFTPEPLLYDALGKLISKKKRYKECIDLRYVYFFIIMKFVDIVNVDYILGKFSVPNMYREKLKEVLINLHEIFKKIKITNLKSEIFRVLYKYPLEIVLLLYALTSDPDIEDKIDEYIFKLRNVKPAISGYDVLKLGIKEGKDVGYILNTVRDRKLDGKIKNKEEEIEEVRSIISKLRREKDDR